MNLSKEEIDKYREGPQEDVVNPIRHRILLLVFSLVRHVLVDFCLFRHRELRRNVAQRGKDRINDRYIQQWLFGTSEVVNMP